MKKFFCGVGTVAFPLALYVFSNELPVLHPAGANAAVAVAVIFLAVCLSTATVWCLINGLSRSDEE